MRRTSSFVAGFLVVASFGCGDDSSAGGNGGGGAPVAGGGGEASDGGAGAGGAPSGGAPSGGGGEGGSFEGVNPIPDGGASATLIQGDYEFTEGTVYLPALGVLRFSDIPGNQIFELDVEGDGSIEVWRAESANTNGNALAPNGDIVMCEHGGRRIARSPAAGAPAPVAVATEFEGDAFNSPNDAIVRSDGTIYFTDPTYGLEGRPQEIPFQGVFGVTPGGEVFLVSDDFQQPNGIGLSPDESTLYVADSQAGGLVAFPVMADGSAGVGTPLIPSGPTDGIAVDDAGNLYLTTANGVEVYAADGTSWGTITVPEQPANCAFGGADRKTLFITARTGLYSVDLVVPGLP